MGEGKLLLRRRLTACVRQQFDERERESTASFANHMLMCFGFGLVNR